MSEAPSSLCVDLEKELKSVRMDPSSDRYTGTRSNYHSNWFRMTQKQDLPPAEKADNLARVIKSAYERGCWVKDYMDEFRAFCKEHEL